jgi:uncharacterized protein, YigZ family
MNKPYRTVLKSAADEVVINKSRFIGYAAPCETEDAALAFLNDIRLKHRDASHCCYAYVIGQNAGIMRYNDDGEPSGTAGLPIMEVLKAQQVVNLCVVVVRYFGGVLLGAGGLVRAYTQGCVIALKAAQVVSMEPTARLICEVSYPLWDKVRHHLQTQPAALESSEFASTVCFRLLVREKDEEAVKQALILLTNAAIEIMLEDTFFSPWDSSF